MWGISGRVCPRLRRPAEKTDEGVCISPLPSLPCLYPLSPTGCRWSFLMNRPSCQLSSRAVANSRAVTCNMVPIGPLACNAHRPMLSPTEQAQLAWWVLLLLLARLQFDVWYLSTGNILLYWVYSIYHHCHSDSNQWLVYVQDSLCQHWPLGTISDTQPAGHFLSTFLFVSTDNIYWTIAWSWTLEEC